MTANLLARDVLRWLDISGVADLPTDLGALNVESLCVSFGFSRQDFLDSLRNIGTSDDLPQHVKTYIHEMTHLFQMTTTPVGLFFHRLRVLQSWLVMEAVRILVAAGLQPTFPLAAALGHVPGSRGTEFAMAIRLWYATELLILFLMGEIETWRTHFTKNRLVFHTGLVDILAATQWCIARCQKDARSRFKAAFPGTLDNHGSQPFGEYQPENWDEMAQAKILGQMAVTDLLVGGTSILAVLEGAAIVSENYGTHLDLHAWRKMVETSRWAHTTGPKSHLVLKMDQVRANSMQEFVLAYIAICDTALHAPILYEHRDLRGASIDLGHLLPYKRWWNLANAASKIDPPSSTADYGRYCDALCEEADLRKMTLVNAFSANAGIAEPSDTYEEIYWKSQALRVRNPGFFTNYPFFVMDGRPQALKQRSDFEFPVIQYSDKTFFLKDKLRLYRMVVGFLTRMATRIMILRSQVQLNLPFEGSPEEKEMYRAEVTTILSTAATTDLSPWITI